MSVLVSKRRESKAEYVNTARELLVKVLQQVKKLPKSITFYITQDVVKHIRDCYTSVCIANSIYLNKENYDLRKSYLQNAQCSLAGFESLFNLVFDAYYSCLTPHQWEQIQVVDVDTNEIIYQGYKDGLHIDGYTLVDVQYGEYIIMYMKKE